MNLEYWILNTISWIITCDGCPVLPCPLALGRIIRQYGSLDRRSCQVGLNGAHLTAVNLPFHIIYCMCTQTNVHIKQVIAVFIGKKITPLIWRWSSLGELKINYAKDVKLACCWVTKERVAPRHFRSRHFCSLVDRQRTFFQTVWSLDTNFHCHEDFMMPHDCRTASLRQLQSSCLCGWQTEMERKDMCDISTNSIVCLLNFQIHAVISHKGETCVCLWG